METIRKELQLQAKTGELDTLLGILEADLDEAGCPVDKQMAIGICAEEIFVNIANYAYEQEEGFAWISETVEDNKISLCFRDSGKPYDPLAREDPDTTLSAEERQIGGLGVFMVKKMSDSVTYEYKEGQNCLAMVFSW